MQLTRITVEGYQRITNLDIEVQAPVLFVTGHNEAGKTSLADAIRHAFIGEPGRVKLKKEFGDLVNDDFKKGVVSLEWQRSGQTGGASVVIPAGTRTIDLEPTAVHACLLDSRHFSGMTANERRGLIFGLSKIRVTGTVIRGKLLEEGARAEKVESIAPILLAGFEAAEKEARSKVSEALGSWKATTGEAYGSIKAGSWKATEPVWTQEAIDEAEGLTSMASDLLDQANISLGAMQEQKRTTDQLATKVLELREKAGMLDRINAKLEKDEAELADWTAKVEQTQAKASGAQLVKPLACPHCAGLVEMEYGELVQYEAPDYVADPEAIRILPEYRQALARVQSWVDNDRRDLAAATQAKASLAELESKAPTNISDDTLIAERKRVKPLQEGLADARKKLDAERLNKTQAAQAAENTVKAAGYHQDVLEWNAITSMLAPSGIQSKMTATAMAPIRERLQVTSAKTGWQVVTIDDDMNVRVGGRPYGLNSQSAKWRADTAITEAIAHLSGERMFMVDEVDVLDSENRMVFLTWMHGLATSKQIDTALIIGTFKEPPKCPPTFQVEWIQNGALRFPLKAAA